eukprot:m51a1_g13673 hypothetical protein (70) ;mRNA; f:39-248
MRSLTLACSGPSLCGILGHLPATLETLTLVRVPPELPDDAQDAPQQPLAFSMLRVRRCPAAVRSSPGAR